LQGSAAVSADNTSFAMNGVLPAPTQNPLRQSRDLPFIEIAKKEEKQNNINHSKPKVLQGSILAYIAFETPGGI
jgi:hypothetical protein